MLDDLAELHLLRRIHGRLRQIAHNAVILIVDLLAGHVRRRTQQGRPIPHVSFFVSLHSLLVFLGVRRRLIWLLAHVFGELLLCFHVSVHPANCYLLSN